MIMSENKLNRETTKKVDELVKRVAKKAGYSGSTELTYQEHLQMKIGNVQKKFDKKIQKQRHKLGLSPKNNDFAEEIKTYLTDGVSDLMAEGYTEEEALQITLEKFDEAELKPDFEDFMEEFNDFGIQENMEWYAKEGEAIGLFYGAFTILGLTLGAFFGFLAGRDLISTAIGTVVGLGCGVGLGLLSHALYVAIKRK